MTLARVGPDSRARKTQTEARRDLTLTVTVTVRVGLDCKGPTRDAEAVASWLT